MKTLKVRQDMGTVDKTGEGQDGTGKEIDQDRKASALRGRKDTVVGQNNNGQQRTKRGSAGQAQGMQKDKAGLTWSDKSGTWQDNTGRTL